MFSALAVAARPQRETVECYAAMLLVVNYVLQESCD